MKNWLESLAKGKYEEVKSLMDEYGYIQISKTPWYRDILFERLQPLYD